ncbi:DUF6065 family protein [Micromonospora sp. C95]|uniref:DUF6065 family protein n=1 Tax=Micromonospora sp. C95 TaxID=2824882 RepID=UPI001B38E82A|nr:DUF6065 family protein [Micromonospora sp. C95]MBQ1023942.1 hypothetical protein [Micromonospora sp. C95]
MTETDAPSEIEFFSLYPDVREPELGTPDLKGSLSARAARVCSPITTASGFGWHIYPPADFAVRWDGMSSEWSLLDGNEPIAWQSLTGARDGLLPEARGVRGAIEAAGLDGGDVFDKYGGVPPFIQADPRNPHMLEVITGLLARTPADWWLLVRSVPNWPSSGEFEILEGIIETDWYRSYIPTMVRLTQQNRIVRFYRHIPIMAVQPVSRATVRMARRAATTYRGVPSFPDGVWDEFVTWRTRKQDPNTAATYVKEQRSRNKRTAEPRSGEPRQRVSGASEEV